MAETCTMGDTGGYVGSVILSVPFALLASFIIFKVKPTNVYFENISASLILILCLFVGYIWSLLLVNTTISGNHLCGPDYNSYLNEYGTNYWYIPLIQLIACAQLMFFSIRSAHNKSSKKNTVNRTRS
ncbi:hypothetical protein ACJJIW_20805 [Microbulbifer sp. JMSA004]|uniref:hypothetical protein n=1 Tax=unclassified Microbulbifer TaxID=2619833 RepID=UPI0024AD80DE|nr:hypothetical protein [Microbulbifer sp. VAAF005]WHI46429.1 hypothetical protein P0078_22410 [Microbulbifer sp. VAAF005]